MILTLSMNIALDFTYEIQLRLFLPQLKRIFSTYFSQHASCLYSALAMGNPPMPPNLCNPLNIDRHSCIIMLMYFFFSNIIFSSEYAWYSALPVLMIVCDGINRGEVLSKDWRMHRGNEGACFDDRHRYLSIW